MADTNANQPILCVKKCIHPTNPLTDICPKCDDESVEKKEIEEASLQSNSGAIAEDKEKLVSSPEVKPSSASDSLASDTTLNKLEPLVMPEITILDQVGNYKMKTNPFSPKPTISKPTREARATVRCIMCKKKVGLFGFTCRCEGMFCGTHRYSDKHNCSYDFHQENKKFLAASNPQVTAPKLIDRA